MLVAILVVQRCSLTNTTLMCCRKTVAILDECSSSPSKCGKHIICITDGCRLELMSDQELSGHMLQPASTRSLFPCLRSRLFVPFIVWARSPRILMLDSADSAWLYRSSSRTCPGPSRLQASEAADRGKHTYPDSGLLQIAEIRFTRRLSDLPVSASGA